MSVTGPGCAHCDGGRVTTPEGDVRPCDRCGGWSQFAQASGDEAVERLFYERGGASTATRPVVTTPRPRCATCGAVADLICPRHGWTEAQPAAPSPETDWRPLPSCAEVLAHSARTGGEAFASWLRLPAGDDAVACVVMLAALDREATPGVTAKVVVELLRGERLPYPGDTYRPITRRGEALPWPEAPR